MPTLPTLDITLTKRVAETHKGLGFILDHDTRGLALRLTAGSRSWVFRGRVHGRWTVQVIGHAPEMTLEAARARVAKLRDHLNNGNTIESFVRPIRDTIPTFAELEKAYMVHADAHKAASTVKGDRYHLAKHVPATWRKREITTISRADVNALHRALKKQHRGRDKGEDREDYRGATTANQTIRLLRAMLNWGYDNDMRAMATRDDNPAARIEMFPERKVERYLSREELERLNASLLQENFWIWKAYFPLVLMLGLRKSEATSLRWAWINWEKRTLTIPKTKNRKPHTAILTDAVINLLSGLPSRNGPLVFPGRDKTLPILGVQKAWQRICDRASLHDLRVHDLRHSLASFMVAAGYGLPMIGKVLNHSSPTVTNRYAHLDNATVRDAMANSMPITPSILSEVPDIAENATVPALRSPA